MELRAVFKYTLHFFPLLYCIVKHSRSILFNQEEHELPQANFMDLDYRTL
jgi:hypothetical protein